MATSLGELFVVLRAQTKQFKTDMQGAAATLKNHQAGLASVSAASAAMSAGLVMAGKQLAKVAADFEFSITRVGALAKAMPKHAGGISKEFEALKSAARIMGEQTEFSAKEAADGMQFLAMAGFNAKQTIEAMPSVLQLATAGVVDLATAADITSNVVAGLGMELKELPRVNDVLVNAFTSTNTTLRSLGESFKYVGPVAKGAGVEFKELTAAIGMLGNAGIQGSMAGTTMRQAIVRLLKPPKEAKEIIDKFGLSTEIAGGKIKSMTGIIRKLEKGGADVTDIIKLFGIRAGPGMATLVDMGSDALERLTQKMGRTGTAAEIQAALLNTSHGQMKLLSSAVESLQISLGNALLPILKDVVSIFQDIVGRFNALSPSAKEMAVKIGIVVAALSGLLAALTGLAAVFPLIVAGFTAMAAAAGVAGTPFLIAAAAIAGLIVQVGILRLAWKNDLFGIRDITANVVDFISTAFKNMGRALKGTFGGMAKGLDMLANPLKAMRGEKGVFQSSVEGMFDADIMKATAKDVGESIAAPLGAVGVAIKDGFSSSMDMFKDLLNTVMPKSLKTGMGKALADLTKGLAGGALPGAKKSGAGAKIGAAAQRQVDAINQAIEMAAGAFDKFAANSKDLFAEMDRDVQDARAALRRANFAAGMKGIDADVKAAVAALRSAMKRAATGMNMVKEAGFELVSRMGEGGQAISNIVKGFQKGGLFGGIATAAVEILSRAKSFKKISGQLSEMLYTLADAFGPFLDALVPIIGLINQIVKVLGFFIKGLAKFASLIGKGLSAIGRGLKKLGSKIAGSKVGQFFRRRWGEFKSALNKAFGVSDKKTKIDIKNLKEGTKEYYEARTAIRRFAEQVQVLGGVAAATAKTLAEAHEAPKWWEDPAFAPEEDKSLSKYLTDFSEDFRDQLASMSDSSDIQDMTKELNEWYQDVWSRLQKAMDMGALTDAEFGAAKTEMEETYTELMDAISGAASGLDEMSDNIEEVNEQLTNVPAGYKVALARFQATTAEGQAGVGAGVGALADTGAVGTASKGDTFVIENLAVQAVDPADIVDQLKTEAAFETYARTGSTVAMNNQADTTAGAR